MKNGNFNNWLAESESNAQKELAKWFSDEIQKNFNVHPGDFSIRLDDFLSKFGMKNFDLLKKYNLIKIFDKGSEKWVKTNFSYVGGGNAASLKSADPFYPNSSGGKI